MSKSGPIISLRNIEKTYANGVQALGGITLDVQTQEFVVVIGLSGSGKSTLLRCLNRLHSPTGGQIYFRGWDISGVRGREEREVRQKIAMVFQHFNLVGRHTVLNNVLMGALSRTATLKSILGMYSNEDKQKALGYLKLVGIESKAYLRASQLSGGQQQRVAIARALMQQPEVLLADEPVASLDPATAHTVLDYIEKVNKELGITVICNLHYLSLVRRYATRVIALRSGKVIFDGPPAKIDREWFRQIYGEDAKDIQIE